jgi:hypothetical protein
MIAGYFVRCISRNDVAEDFVKQWYVLYSSWDVAMEEAETLTRTHEGDRIVVERNTTIRPSDCFRGCVYSKVKGYTIVINAVVKEDV